MVGVADDGFRRARLAVRQLRSQRGFYRALARYSASPGCTLIELPGVEAIAFPACPRSSLFNTVFSYESVSALEEALPELAHRFAGLGVGTWAVAVTEPDPAAVRLLADAGYVHAWTAERMGQFIVPLAFDQRAPLALVPHPTWETIAYCNDRAYRVGETASIAPVLVGVDDPAFHLYAATEEREPVCSVVTREEQGDCYIWFVATVPEVRRRGTAIELARLALREARSRGCETATGESTPAAAALYTALGASSLGRMQVWAS